MNKVTQFTLALLFGAVCAGPLEAQWDKHSNRENSDHSCNFKREDDRSRSGLLDESSTGKKDHDLEEIRQKQEHDQEELTAGYKRNIRVLITSPSNFRNLLDIPVNNAYYTTTEPLSSTSSSSISLSPSSSSRDKEAFQSREAFITALVQNFQEQNIEFKTALTFAILNDFIGNAENMRSQNQVTQKRQNIAAVESFVSDLKTRHNDYAPVPQGKMASLLSSLTGFGKVESNTPTSAINPEASLQKAVGIATTIQVSSSESEERYVHHRHDYDESKHSSSSSSLSSSSVSNNNSRRSSGNNTTNRGGREIYNSELNK